MQGGERRKEKKNSTKGPIRRMSVMQGSTRNTETQRSHRIVADFPQHATNWEKPFPHVHTRSLREDLVGDVTRMVATARGPSTQKRSRDKDSQRRRIGCRQATPRIEFGKKTFPHVLTCSLREGLVERTHISRTLMRDMPNLSWMVTTGPMGSALFFWRMDAGPVVP